MPLGSPPRMRGKLQKDNFTSISNRITPAHAGKTNFSSTGINTEWDHPRACGENFTLQMQILKKQGSPPRMRGKLVIALLAVVFFVDHPRACGENSTVKSVCLRHRGSPPRMRGKLTLPSSRISVVRITPAHAGKTLCVAPSRPYQADHPRACGENY